MRRKLQDLTRSLVGPPDVHTYYLPAGVGKTSEETRGPGSAGFLADEVTIAFLEIIFIVLLY